ncbi:Arylsulfatase [Pontiella desulfatans]|uniref:Arylsulfatase n=1 Tax=Pontiella desulfatans TaxID=2750659 RepID=A0A6C2U1X9_PONDE|nr:sulfatase-like hydrolase/transferase [Pontiella desulfatans]SPS73894.1 sulfatase S1_15 [Kiritimatiellales bacterium]VGO13962.1 Arylsulfatase [Pontiella desulfatans]
MSRTTKGIRTIIAAGALAAVAAVAAQKKPNIVIFLADDYGYGSSNCYGTPESVLKTPHMNRLAEKGMRFTQAYAPAAVCTPTRYGLLTGRYCWRTGMRRGVVNVCDRLLIDEGRFTLPQMLKDDGYRTAVIGKWHLGFGKQEGKRADPERYFKPITKGPLSIGFDYFFGLPQNHGDYTGIYMENHEVYGRRSFDKIEIEGKSPYGKAWMGVDAPQRVDDEVMDVLTEKAAEWLNQQPDDQPVFLYFAAPAVHAPVTPSKRFKGTLAAGPFAEFIQDLDWSLGEVVKAFEKSGRLENTLFIFSSDNGGVYGDEIKEWTREVPGVWKLKSQVTQMRQAGAEVNGIYRGGKQDPLEGGTRVPFIVSWPGHVKAGTVNDDKISLVDMTATLAELLHIETPAKELGAEDSVSVLDTFYGKPVDRDALATCITHSGAGTFALTLGNWKYIEGAEVPIKGKKMDPPGTTCQNTRALYDLEKDPHEDNNLIEANPEVAKKMQALLDQTRTRSFSRKH